MYLYCSIFTRICIVYYNCVMNIYIYIYCIVAYYWLYLYCLLQRLLSHTQTELKSTWSAVQERSAERRLWIDNTTKMLNTIEDERTNRVCNVLTLTYYTRVVSVCNAVTIPVSKPKFSKNWLNEIWVCSPAYR